MKLNPQLGILIIESLLLLIVEKIDYYYYNKASFHSFARLRWPGIFYFGELNVLKKLSPTDFGVSGIYYGKKKREKY